MRALGLMSGTSMDGIDLALLETDGEVVDRFGPTGFRPYSGDERAAIRRAAGAAGAVTSAHARPGPLALAEEAVTRAHAEAVEAFLERYRITPDKIDIIGFHGQTVIHRPDLGFTVQLGDGAALAERLEIDVVYDLRARDMESGGQGAPLVPVYHRALVEAAGLQRPVAVVNIGGVANVTWIGDGDPLAFDTGPGNALIDDLVWRRTGKPYDRDGRLASAGTVDPSALDRLMEDPFFDKPPPKSLDRQAFDAAAVADLAIEDAAATLAAFTGAALAAAGRHFPAPPSRWIVAGGGARNLALMAALAERVTAPVASASALGWSPDHLEAQAFAFLAVRSLKDLPLTFPTTTGATRPTTGGRHAMARGRGRAFRG